MHIHTYIHTYIYIKNIQNTVYGKEEAQCETSVSSWSDFSKKYQYLPSRRVPVGARLVCVV